MKLRPWIIIDTSVNPAVFRCTRCGAKRPMHLPAAITDWIKQGEAFTESHKFCKEDLKCLKSTSDTKKHRATFTGS